jgi:hypothetical protein
MAVVALLAAGCSGQAVKSVKGKVTYNGEPLAGAELEFVPQSDLTIGGFGDSTDADGTFEIRIGKGTGRNARSGSFVVLVTKGKGIGITPPDNYATMTPEERERAMMKATAPGAVSATGSTAGVGVLPAQYSNKSTTPFHFDLAEGENDIGTLKLTGPPLKK